MTGLENRYRRMLTLLPRAYREERAEEMLSTLLDGAAPGQHGPRISEVVSLAALAVRLRAGAPGGSARAVLCGDVLRRTALLGLLVQTLLYSTFSTFGAVATTSSGGFGMRHVVVDYVQPLTLAACFISLVAGRHRAGRALSLATAAIACYSFVAMALYGIPVELDALLAVSLVCTIATQVGFHRDAPAVASRRRWFVLAGVSCAVVLAASAAGSYFFLSPALQSFGGNQITPILGYSLVVSPLGPALAIAFAAAHARRSPIWPASLLVLGLPVLLVVPSSMSMISQGQFGNLLPGPVYLNNSLPSLGMEALATEAVLAAILIRALIRHRPGRDFNPRQA